MVNYFYLQFYLNLLGKCYFLNPLHIFPNISLTNPIHLILSFSSYSSFYARNPHGQDTVRGWSANAWAECFGWRNKKHWDKKPRFWPSWVEQGLRGLRSVSRYRSAALGLFALELNKHRPRRDLPTTRPAVMKNIHQIAPSHVYVACSTPLYALTLFLSFFCQQIL